VHVKMESVNKSCHANVGKEISDFSSRKYVKENVRPAV
jgi:hypothetical protein